MHHSRILTAFAFVSVAILAVPTYVTSQTTTDKLEQKAKSAAQANETNAPESKPTSKAKPRRSGPELDVNEATFEQFRELGMSVTQATRVIAYRERQDGFAAVEDLEAVPGLPKKLMDEIRDQLTA